MKIGIYPGSFDPIHLGHIQIVNKILKEKIVDKVLIVPTNDYWSKNILVNLKDRIKMIQLFETENISVETKDNNIQATYDLIKQKEKENPNDSFSLIIGGDNIQKIDKWINSSELLKYPFIVIKRDNFNEEYIKSRFKELNKTNYTILQTENIEISSSQIRESLKKGYSLEGLLDKHVYDYIVSNNLYR